MTATIHHIPLQKSKNIECCTDKNFISHIQSIRCRSEQMKAANQLCEKFSADIRNSFHETYANESIFDVIHDVASSYENQPFYCYLFGKSMNCDEILSPILTEDGNCLAFNSLNVDDVSRNG